MSEEQARPKWVWLPGAKRYYNNETHRFASFAQVDQWARETLRVSTAATDTLAQMVADQRLNVADWQRQMKQVIKSEHIVKYVSAHGGLETMTQSDWGRVGATIRKQYGFLRGFAQEIADGTLTEAQIRARAAMYVRSSRDAFERGMANAQGAPDLPAYPGDGSTECLCIVSGESRVLTAGGWVPIKDVRPGDLALTHMGRWMPVLATIIKPSEPYHRLAKIQGPTGQWVECTDNHLWYTPQGWRSASDMDSNGLSWYHVHESLLERVGHDKVRSTVRQDFLQAIPQGSPRPLLLPGLLPQSTILYDLLIEGDHSFVIEGLIAHNSNCRCHWSIREFNDRWECAWVLDPMGHETCGDCVERSQTWSPLIIRKEGEG